MYNLLTLLACVSFQNITPLNQQLCTTQLKQHYISLMVMTQGNTCIYVSELTNNTYRLPER